VFPQQLAASTTRCDVRSVTYTSDGNEFAPTAHVQFADHGALCAQRETIRRIFYVATRDDSAVVNKRCCSNAKF
jgi:hypothetical protein